MSSITSGEENAGQRLYESSQVTAGFSKKIAFDESRRCPQCASADCLPACPLNVDIPGFIRLLREGRVDLALNRIYQENPFPEICGRLCPAPCEKHCIFNNEGQPIEIRALERFVADNGQASGMRKEIIPLNGKKVCIIGSGASGLSVAYFLAKAGFAVTVLEASSHIGGALRYAIGHDRLPLKVIDNIIDRLKAMAVVFKTGVLVGSTVTFEALMSQGYDAIILAAGSAQPHWLNIAGEGLTGVYYGREFLMIGQHIQEGKPTQRLVRGEEAIVIGDHYEAVDVIRLLLKFNQKVKWILDKSVNKLMINPHDIDQIIGEGVDIKNAIECIAIEGNQEGEASTLVYRSKKKSIGVLERFEAQTIVICSGSQPNNSVDALMNIYQQGSSTKVFSVKPLLSKEDNVVHALAQGKETARLVKEYLC